MDGRSVSFRRGRAVMSRVSLDGLNKGSGRRWNCEKSFPARLTGGSLFQRTFDDSALF